MSLMTAVAPRNVADHPSPDRDETRPDHERVRLGGGQQRTDDARGASADQRRTATGSIHPSADERREREHPRDMSADDQRDRRASVVRVVESGGRHAHHAHHHHLPDGSREDRGPERGDPEELAGSAPATLLDGRLDDRPVARVRAHRESAHQGAGRAQDGHDPGQQRALTTRRFLDHRRQERLSHRPDRPGRQEDADGAPAPIRRVHVRDGAAAPPTRR